MTCLLPQSVHDQLADLRGKCLDLDGITDTPAAELYCPELRPITINELLAGWAWARMGYGTNAIRYRHPAFPMALTLRDIGDREARIAIVHLWQVAYIEGEPSGIDLTDREEATRRLSAYAWFRPATTGTHDRTGI